MRVQGEQPKTLRNGCRARLLGQIAPIRQDAIARQLYSLLIGALAGLGVPLESRHPPPSSDFTYSDLQPTHFSPPRMKLFRVTHLAHETDVELCGRSFFATNVLHSSIAEVSLDCLGASRERHGNGFKNECRAGLLGQITLLR